METKINKEQSFNQFKLPTSLLRGLELLKFKTPYPIQEKAIPVILNDKDVLGIAKTGSGKTASYVLPILALMDEKPLPKSRHIQALVLVPTRELAMQVGEVFEQFEKYTPSRIKTMAVHGGVSINPQMINMQGVRILIATPGRLLDLYDSKAMQLSSVSVLVLDEADKLMNLGFKEEVNRIISLLPNKRQNLLFSATLNDDVNNVTSVLLKDPEIIKIESDDAEEHLIQQSGYFVTEERKGPLLRYLIKEKKMEQVMVFTSSIYKADSVANKLRKNGISAEAIHGKKSQGARKKALTNFKNGTLPVLVTTDLLSRGIDIAFLPFVINYELPRSPKDFIHRIGRTGRAENPGNAIVLITPEELPHFKVIQKKMKTRVKMEKSEGIELRGY